MLSVKVPDPKFSSQTKDKLVSSEVRPVVESVINEALQDWFEDPPAGSQGDRRQGGGSRRRARSRAQGARTDPPQGRARSSIRCPASSPTARSATRPSPNCSSSRATSAGGSAKQGRNREFQAVLPLRGKILNVERARFDKMLGSQEIGTLITALGTGIGRDEFNPDKLRYHKIIIMTDADVDGAHIRTLLLTFFFRQMAELIERGHLYIAQPPLYKVNRGKSEQYLKDERALEDYLIADGLEDAVLRLASGEERAGADLRTLVEEARAIRNILNGLHSRYNRKVIEQAAIAGVLNPEVTQRRQERRPPPPTTSPSGSMRSPKKPSAAGRATFDESGFHFERTVRGVKEVAVIDSGAARLRRRPQARRISPRPCSRSIRGRRRRRCCAARTRPWRSTARSACSRRSPPPAARASRCSATKVSAR